MVRGPLDFAQKRNPQMEQHPFFFFIEDGTALVEQPISFWCLSCYRRHIPERQEKSDYSPYGCLRQRQRELNSTSCTKKKTEEFKKKKDIVHDPGPQKRSPLDLHAWNRFYLFEGKSDQSIHKSSGRRVAFVRCQRTKGTILVSSTDSKHISTNRTATETRIFLWELATLSHTARASVADHKWTWVLRIIYARSKQKHYELNET